MHPLIFSFGQPDVYEINSTKPDLFVQHDVTSCINDRVMAVPAETSAMHPILFKVQTDTALCKNNVTFSDNICPCNAYIKAIFFEFM